MLIWFMIKVVKTKFVWNCAVCSSLFLLHFYSRSSNNFMWTTYIRVGKTGSLGPWGRVIVYCSSFPFAEMIVPFGGSFWQKDSLLQCTITLLHGPKDPVLPTLTYISSLFECLHDLNESLLQNIKSNIKGALKTFTCKIDMAREAKTQYLSG